jgi:tetratricopeptide (TPR) repeat protein
MVMADTGGDADLVPGAERASDTFLRLGLGEGEAVQDVLRAVRSGEVELLAACPLHASLEWQLSALFWFESGLVPFLDNSVPYLINNSGRLSESAAVVLFENLREDRPTGDGIDVVELGAGSGLFAKLFLDAFQEICRDRGEDFYQRLTYVVTDGSPRTVEDWRERKMFEAHADHVRALCLDARDPGGAFEAHGRAPGSRKPRAIFCNYVLDVLPATVWRKREGRIEELLVATQLSASGPALSTLTTLTVEEIARRARDREGLRELLPLLPWLEPRVHFEEPKTPTAWDGAARAYADAMKDGERIAVNVGAFDCLERCLTHLDEHGFVMVNDYGLAGAIDQSPALPQRFGRTVAMGLNFPLLERCFVERGFSVFAPPGDEGRSVHTRLLTRGPLPQTYDALALRFSIEAERALDAPLVAAREHAAAGRTGEGLDAYRAALEHTPKDWHLLGEIAEFVGLIVRDYASGVQIARRALELNPWTSGWLWNILGDCLYYLDRQRDAHEAFLKAEAIDPDDARTNLNLAHSFAWIGQHAAALKVIARGLCHDKGAYRSRLMQQQERTLGLVASQQAALQDQMARRLERLAAE